MATINTTFTLTAPKSSSGGPLSVALALSASDALAVDNVTSQIITPPNSGAPTKFLDGTMFNTDATDAPGDYGGFVWVKNTSAASTSNLIYIGMAHLQGGAAPANMGGGDGTTALDASDDSTFRIMTLKVGEFAFFPWDYMQDLYCGASTTAQTLEYWVFDRAS